MTVMTLNAANSIITTPYCILSYPRSGSHYLQNLLLANLGLSLNRYHDIDSIKIKDRYIIAILRNPVDAIASDITKKIKNNMFKLENIDHIITMSISDFILRMKQIQDHADILIKFDDLVNNSDAVCDNVANVLNLKRFNNNQDITVHSEDIGPDPFIASSKNLESYEWVYDYISSFDMSLAIDAYDSVLATL